MQFNCCGYWLEIVVEGLQFCGPLFWRLAGHFVASVFLAKIIRFAGHVFVSAADLLKLFQIKFRGPKSAYG